MKARIWGTSAGGGAGDLQHAAGHFPKERFDKGATKEANTRVSTAERRSGSVTPVGISSLIGGSSRLPRKRYPALHPNEQENVRWDSACHDDTVARMGHPLVGRMAFVVGTYD